MKKGIWDLLMKQIQGIFLPIIDLITAASILKSLVVLMQSAGLYETTGGFYQIFYAVSDGFFFFLPMFLAITAAKQWKANPYIAMLIPIAMLYPGIVEILENGGSFKLFFLTVPPTVYHSSVIPVLMSVGLLAWIEKPCDKYLPEIVRGFLKPIICCLIVLPFTFLFFGPLGTMIGDVLTKAFFTIYKVSAVAAGAFMGLVMQPMVVIGAHWSVVPVSINNIMTTGYDVIMPLVGGAVYGQAGAAFAVGLMYKNKEKRRLAIQASVTAILGVTEPALFGVNVPLVRPMISACLAGALGGAVAGIAGAHCNSFAFPSFLTSVAYVGPGFGLFLISMAMGFPLGFIFTMLQKKQILSKLDE